VKGTPLGISQTDWLAHKSFLAATEPQNLTNAYKRQIRVTYTEMAQNCDTAPSATQHLQLLDPDRAVFHHT